MTRRKLWYIFLVIKSILVTQAHEMPNLHQEVCIPINSKSVFDVEIFPQSKSDELETKVIIEATTTVHPRKTREQLKVDSPDEFKKKVLAKEEINHTIQKSDHHVDNITELHSGQNKSGNKDKSSDSLLESGKSQEPVKTVEQTVVLIDDTESLDGRTQREQENRELAREQKMDKEIEKSLLDEKSDEEEEINMPAKSRFNFASLDAGAVILSSSRGMKHSGYLLIGDRDKYALSACEEEKKWVVVGLSEEIKPDEFVLANYEKFSSTVANFTLLGASTYPTNEWLQLGEYRATPQLGPQHFKVQNSAWVRYLLFRFQTWHGVEYYCTLSEIRVFGSTDQFHVIHEDFEKQQEENEKIINSIDNALLPDDAKGNKATDATPPAVQEPARETDSIVETPPAKNNSEANDTASSDQGIQASVTEDSTVSTTSIPPREDNTEDSVTNTPDEVDGTVVTPQIHNHDSGADLEDPLSNHTLSHESDKHVSGVEQGTDVNAVLNEEKSSQDPSNHFIEPTTIGDTELKTITNNATEAPEQHTLDDNRTSTEHNGSSFNDQEAPLEDTNVTKLHGNVVEVSKPNVTTPQTDTDTEEFNETAATATGTGEPTNNKVVTKEPKTNAEPSKSVEGSATATVVIDDIDTSGGRRSSLPHGPSSGGITGGKNSMEKVFQSLGKKVLDLELEQSVFKKYLEDTNKKYASVISELQGDITENDDALSTLETRISQLERDFETFSKTAKMQMESTATTVKMLKQSTESLEHRQVWVEDRMADFVIFGTGCTILLWIGMIVNICHYRSREKMLLHAADIIE